MLTSADHRHPLLWQLPELAGLRWAAVGLFGTHPPAPLPGSLISYPMQQTLHACYPPDLHRRLAALGVRPVHDVSIWWSGQARDALLPRLLEADERRARAARLLFDEGADVTLVNLTAPDRCSHIFWQELELGEEGEATSAVLDAYRGCDRILGEFLGRADERTAVVAFSEIGFGPLRAYCSMNEVLAAAGLLARTGDGRVDWAATAGFEAVQGSHGVNVNLRGRYAQGTVGAGDYDRIRDELAAALLAAVNPRTGLPYLAAARPREQVYAGTAVQQAPDLVLEPADSALPPARRPGLGLARAPDLAERLAPAAVVLGGDRRRAGRRHRRRSGAAGRPGRRGVPAGRPGRAAGRRRPAALGAAVTGTTTRLLPLAITGVDGHEACVGALDETGRWLRPEPVTIAEVTAADPAYRYWHWTEASLGPSTCDDARPEDRALLAPPRPGPPAVPAADRAALLDGHADTDVQAAIGDAHRSLGLVRADVREVYLRRSTGGRTFVRCRFTDGTGAEHDWIVPEIAFAARAREADPQWTVRDGRPGRRRGGLPRARADQAERPLPGPVRGLPPARRRRAPGAGGGGPVTRRALLLGLDGMPLDLLRRLAADGVMPAAAGLLAAGTAVELEAPVPEISSTSWASFLTGTNPGRHGVYGFVDLVPGSYEPYFPDVTALRAPPLWEHAGAAGLSTLCLNVPGTYPAPAIRGAVVSGFVAPSLDRAVSPARLLAPLRRRGYPLDVEVGDPAADPAGFLDRLRTAITARAAAFEHLLDTEPGTSRSP